jgi:hypothetical protein
MGKSKPAAIDPASTPGFTIHHLRFTIYDSRKRATNSNREIQPVRPARAGTTFQIHD